MKLTLAVAAPRGALARPMMDALHAAGALSSGLVSVVVAQHSSRPFGDAVPGIDLITAPQGASIFRLWGLALLAASTPHVALLDARCPIDRDWLSAMLANLGEDAAALYGPVSCGWPSNSPHIVGYLVEYAQFDPPLSPKLTETPGVNLVVARTLATDPAVLIRGEFVKTRLLGRLDSEDKAARPVLAATVTYRKTYRFPEYCLHRFDHGRCYGASRQFTGLGARLLAIVTTPLLPFLRAWRIHRAARSPGMRSAYWRWLHRILAAETAWSFGEVLGYMTGEGDSRGRLI